MQDLFESTQPLAEIGRGTYRQAGDVPMMAPRRPEFVRVVFDGLPRVSTRTRLGDAVALEEELRKAQREQLDLVYPYRLLEWFELAGVRLEPVDPSRVFAGQELIGGVEHRKVGPIERCTDLVTGAAGRCLDLHALALAGIQTPRGGPADEAWSDGRWRLQWRLGDGGVIEVAARIERPEVRVAVRGSYAVAGPSIGPGFRPLPERSELVAEVARTGSPEEAMFWLAGEALEDAIWTIHPQVLAEAILGRSED